MKSNFKTVWYTILIIGCVIGFIWGFSPGIIIDSAFFSNTTDQQIIREKPMLIFATVYGYLSILLIIVSMISELVYASTSKRKLEQKVRAEVFQGGSAKITREKFRQACELTDEEITKLFSDSQREFTFDDYLRARKYLGTLNKGNPFQIKP